MLQPASRSGASSGVMAQRRPQTRRELREPHRWCTSVWLMTGSVKLVCRSPLAHVLVATDSHTRATPTQAHLFFRFKTEKGKYVLLTTLVSPLVCQAHSCRRVLGHRHLRHSLRSVRGQQFAAPSWLRPVPFVITTGSCGGTCLGAWSTGSLPYAASCPPLRTLR